jgi:hypothetical protein
MTWGAVASIGVGLYTASENRSAASRASDAATQANERAMAFEREMFDKQMELNKPYREAGITGQNRLMELLGLGGNTGAAGYGKYGRDFSMADYQADPGYAFRLSEGQKALERSAAARGGLISGGALRAAARYGQDMGSQEYGAAYNRYQTNRTNQLQPLGNIATMGANVSTNNATAAGDYGSRGGKLLSDTGVAQGNALLAAQRSNNSAYGDIAKSFGSMDVDRFNLNTAPWIGGGSVW